MKILRILILLAILSGIAGWGYVHREELVSPCLPPLRYSVADIDSRFGVSEEIVLAAAREAERVWEDVLERDVFVYDPEAEFTVEFVYDKRQENTFRARDLEYDIEAEAGVYEDLKEDLDAQNEKVESLLEAYQTRSSEYAQDVRALNHEIAHWNARGGAPEDIYEDILEKQEALREEREALNELADRINTLSSDARRIVEAINTSADAVNENVAEHNALFADMPTFDKGVYRGENIVLYQFTSYEDLVLTLAHEFGHALGVGHVGDPEAVMYSYIEDQPLDPVTAAPEDVEAASEACRFDTYGLGW